MKTAPLATLMLLLLTTSIIAQEASDPPDVSVLEKSWSKNIQYRERDSRILNQSPLATNENLMRQTREEKR